jgi:heptosyltransferase-2
MTERILVVAPSWVGDAILSEPFIARLHSRGGVLIDVLAPPWCAPVYERMRAVDRVIANPFRHGALDLSGRRAFGKSLRAADAGQGYSCAYVLPNSWKSALVPWFAGIPRRIGYSGEARWGLVTDRRRLDRKRTARLVDRFLALAERSASPTPSATAPVLVPDSANRDACMDALALDAHAPIAILCPGAEYGPAKRWPPEQFAQLAGQFLRDRMQVWLLGSPNDKPSSTAVIEALPAEQRHQVRDLTGLTDVGSAIDLLSVAAIVVSNDSGLMHAAAALGVPLVAVFGSSSIEYTPPLSPIARIAKIDIVCSPCYKRECPLGHFKCMRELAPAAVYDLARELRARSTAGADQRP